MLITTHAIVIHSIRYSEADLIVKCFTESSGLKLYLLRNILKSKKGKLKVSMFQPLTQLEIVANHKDKNTLEYIREAKVTKPNTSLYTNIYKSSIVIFLAEMLRNTIQEEEKNILLFQYLDGSISWLNKNENFANFHLLFLLNLTSYLGFYPDESTIGYSYFNLLEGNFQEEKTNKYCVNNHNTDILKELIMIDIDKLAELTLNQTRRKSFLEMLLLYYELHLHGFKKPKSLEILHQLF